MSELQVATQVPGLTNDGGADRTGGWLFRLGSGFRFCGMEEKLLIRVRRMRKSVAVSQSVLVAWPSLCTLTLFAVLLDTVGLDGRSGDLLLYHLEFQLRLIDFLNLLHLLDLLLLHLLDLLLFEDLLWGFRLDCRASHLSSGTCREEWRNCRRSVCLVRLLEINYSWNLINFKLLRPS